uniref:DUF755 domain-containing protein n=1 Tax=Torque teno mini virus 10 TaxID=2065036 RepID=A0A3S8RKD1_9VIRU|nr:hypothetical protein ORF3 [Torque teno mini virus 10]
MQQLRYKIQHKPLKPPSTPLIKDTLALQTQLSNACKETGTLQTFYLQLQKQLDQSQKYKAPYKKHKRTRPRKTKKKHYSSSSSTNNTNTSNSDTECSS